MPELGTDLELRLVRYFTVVAEHRNFSRAAADLHVAQPSLSKQIQRLEHRLGVRLFDRTPQGVVLTDAGEAFLPEARTLLRTARRAMATARAHAAGRIVIGYVEDLLITPAVGELRRLHPRADIVTRHLACHEQGAFTDRVVDVLVARAPLPIPTDDVRVTPLYDEPRKLVVRADDALATRSSVSMDEVAPGQSIICSHGGTRQIFHPTESTSAEALIESFEDRMELVAAGRAVAVLPVGDRRSSLRPDLVTVPLEGFPASSVVVATRAGETNRLVTDFAAAAQTLLVG